MPNPFQEMLDEAFPASTDEAIVRGVSEGVFLADSTLESHNFLKSMVGHDLRGHIRRAGILWRLHEMAAAGDLPFDAFMTRMPRGNWHWVELRSGKITAHVCRTEGPEMFPTDTPTRQDDRLTNQYDMFHDVSKVVPIRGMSAWLTFGVGDSGQLGHLCWGMPQAQKDVWLARTNIIRRLQESAVVVKFEAPSPKIDLKFRQHIEESLNEVDGEDGGDPA